MAAALVVAATTLDLARANRGLLHAPPPAAVLAPPALARAIRAGSAPPHRYYANAVGGPDADSPAAAARVDREILFGATGELYGLANANTPASLNLLAHERLQRALGAAPRERALDALAALGVKYVTSWLPLDRSSVAQRVEVATRAQAPASDPAAPVAARLYRLLPAADRAYVATRIERAASADEATSRFLQAPPGEHAGFAVVEEELAGVEASAGEPRDAVRWVVARADRLALDVRLERSALVVVNDTLAPGWSAALDGVEARLVRVNGVVRGVVAPAGRHRIEMRYRPPGLGAGILLSLVSVALVLALCGGGVAAQVLRPLRDAAARPLGIPARGSPGH